jgi:DNA-binding transcriptional ArsR family regulator
MQTSSARLDATFSALADPTRRSILARLTRGETSVNDLAAPFQMTLPAISKHLKVLEHAGLIARTRHAQWRPCRLQPQPLKSVSQYLESYRQFWEQSFDRLDDYLQKLQATEKKNVRQKQSRPHHALPAGAPLHAPIRRSKKSPLPNVDRSNSRRPVVGPRRLHHPKP